eukprot:266677_1
MAHIFKENIAKIIGLSGNNNCSDCGVDMNNNNGRASRTFCSMICMESAGARHHIPDNQIRSFLLDTNAEGIVAHVVASVPTNDLREPSTIQRPMSMSQTERKEMSLSGLSQHNLDINEELLSVSRSITQHNEEMNGNDTDNDNQTQATDLEVPQPYQNPFAALIDIDGDGDDMCEINAMDNGYMDEEETEKDYLLSLHSFAVLYGGHCIQYADIRNCVLYHVLFINDTRSIR